VIFTANGACYTKGGFNNLVHRGYTVTPTISIPSQFKIGTGTTTPATTDTNLTTPIIGWHAATDYKDFVSTYPTFDTINQQVTVQGFIGASEANGVTITEYGDFNKDGTPSMSSHIVFTGVAKTSAVQIYITTTYKRV
jgi:hypothetical protein